MINFWLRREGGYFSQTRAISDELAELVRNEGNTNIGTVLVVVGLFLLTWNCHHFQFAVPG